MRATAFFDPLEALFPVSRPLKKAFGRPSQLTRPRLNEYGEATRLTGRDLMLAPLSSLQARIDSERGRGTKMLTNKKTKTVLQFLCVLRKPS